ncbi:Retrovirus-related Pol polyprotein from transposon 412 family [Cucumis melo var. makuwa]|uniref:Retrovirus-related Pol polyprotein from transposon 412 family n=1 Tax=Cucumis melo var. makuwa TaxID=1194695 RepID=A0A5A7TIS3_CUCMM|nr:Retrovirus-related Pol polyprotein from transposon 412 family [Cucumis melo var. makuwa]
MDPIKYIFEKPSLSGRIAKWQVLLSEYDIVYVTKKAIKRSTLADHLATQSVADYEPIKVDFPDENIFLVEKNATDHETWIMLFDGASNELGHGIGVVLISPEGKIHVAASPLHILSAPWPFSLWGMDVIGPIDPKASYDHRFILVAIDYFTKWIEVASYCNVTRGVVLKFIKKELICRYGLPKGIITDNAKNLNNKMMDKLCEHFKINHRNSTPYRSKMNGTVEAANKNIKRIIGKMTITYKDWHEMLPFALHGYHTSVRTLIGATPFSLLYGMEAVLPLEVEIPSLRVLVKAKLDEAEWIRDLKLRSKPVYQVFYCCCCCCLSIRLMS